MKRELVKELTETYPRGISKACHLLKVSRSSLKYIPVKRDDVELTEQLRAQSVAYPREGFWKGYFRLRNGGYVVNHKRLHRVYKEMGLPLRRKSKKIAFTDQGTYRGTRGLYTYLEHRLHERRTVQYA